MTGGFSELWKYSTATMMWTQLYLVVGAGGMGMAPSARSGHGMAAVGEDVYVFGGRDDEYTSGKVKGGEGRIGHAWLPCIVCHLGAGVKWVRLTGKPLVPALGAVLAETGRPCVQEAARCRGAREPRDLAWGFP